MKNRASLALMEQLIMLLVFALAAALCLRVFVEAEQLSQKIAQREEGAFLAQGAAELLKSGSSPEELELPEGYELQLQPQEDLPGLEAVEITILYENNPVFTLKTGWQEVAE